LEYHPRLAHEDNHCSKSGYGYQYKNWDRLQTKVLSYNSTELFWIRKLRSELQLQHFIQQGKIDKLDGNSSWQSSKWGGSAAAGLEDFLIEEGGRLGEVYGYKTDGFYTADDFNFNETTGTYSLKSGITNSASLTGGNVYPGSIKLKADADGNIKKVRLGNTIAPVSGGFGLNGRFKNFDFTAFFNYSLGNKVINATKLVLVSIADHQRIGISMITSIDKRYTWIDPATGNSLLSSSSIKTLGAEGVKNRLNELNANASIWNPAAATVMPLIDWAVEDGSFLRVNNISIGYTLPKNLVQKC
jgi:hypothetical protein